MFSQWDRIFKDPMTTAAAIDRLIHRSVILEMTGGSVRAEEAKMRAGGPGMGDPADQDVEGATATKKPARVKKD